MEQIIDHQSSDEGEYSLYQLKVLEDNYTYILALGGLCVCIDPGESEPVKNYLAQSGLDLEAILITHFHQDHCLGAKELKGDKKIPVLGPKHKELSMVNQVVADGDEVSVGPFMMEVIHAPGHTMEHVMYHFAELKLLFCGDVLFLGGCGKMFEGNQHHFFHTFEKIKNLPQDTKILVGHNYNQRNFDFIKHLNPKFSEKDFKLDAPFHTLKQELKINPFLQAKDAQEFLNLYERRDEFRANNSVV